MSPVESGTDQDDALSSATPAPIGPGIYLVVTVGTVVLVGILCLAGVVAGNLSAAGLSPALVATFPSMLVMALGIGGTAYRTGWPLWLAPLLAPLLWIVGIFLGVLFLWPDTEALSRQGERMQMLVQLRNSLSGIVVVRLPSAGILARAGAVRRRWGGR